MQWLSVFVTRKFCRAYISVTTNQSRKDEVTKWT